MLRAVPDCLSFVGAIIGVLLDMDARKARFSLNGYWSKLWDLPLAEVKYTFAVAIYKGDDRARVVTEQCYAPPPF